jgi:hypothetical protein
MILDWRLMPLMELLASTQHVLLPRTTRKFLNCFDSWLTSLIAVPDFAAPWFFVLQTEYQLKARREFVGVNYSNLLPIQVVDWNHCSGFAKLDAATAK